MKLCQRIKTLIMSSQQRTIPESHTADDVLKIMDIADKCRKLVSHK